LGLRSLVFYFGLENYPSASRKIKSRVIFFYFLDQGRDPSLQKWRTGSLVFSFLPRNYPLGLAGRFAAGRGRGVVGGYRFYLFKTQAGGIGK
jgi:hypothetical protein